MHGEKPLASSFGTGRWRRLQRGYIDAISVRRRDEHAFDDNLVADALRGIENVYPEEFILTPAKRHR
jgi:hypothetical protein